MVNIEHIKYKYVVLLCLYLIPNFIILSNHDNAMDRTTVSDIVVIDLHYPYPTLDLFVCVKKSLNDRFCYVFVYP